MDVRHEKRQEMVQKIYASLYQPSIKADPLIKPIIDSSSKLDSLIRLYAKKYPIDKIAKVDLAILRLALYEITIEKKQPLKVIINEAVELAKELGGDNSYSFVNAVLGKIVNQHK